MHLCWRQKLLTLRAFSLYTVGYTCSAARSTENSYNFTAKKNTLSISPIFAFQFAKLFCWKFSKPKTPKLTSKSLKKQASVHQRATSPSPQDLPAARVNPPEATLGPRPDNPHERTRTNQKWSHFWAPCCKLWTGKMNIEIKLLKLIHNSLRENKGNHNCDSGLDTRS